MLSKLTATTFTIHFVQEIGPFEKQLHVNRSGILVIGNWQNSDLSKSTINPFILDFL